MNMMKKMLYIITYTYCWTPQLRLRMMEGRAGAKVSTHPEYSSLVGLQLSLSGPQIQSGVLWAPTLALPCGRACLTFGFLLLVYQVIIMIDQLCLHH